MPIYHRAGIVPAKRHTVFRTAEGNLYHEELFGTEGFSGLSSLLYHIFPPTRVIDKGEPFSVNPKVALAENITPRSYTSFYLKPEADYISSRKVLFLNHDLTIGVFATQQGNDDYFFKNADADEIIFIHKGKGVLYTAYGSLSFAYGDYLVIPRGTIYKMIWEEGDNRALIIESFSPVETPARYRNDYGQFLEHSPFCERDIRIPENLVTHEEEGKFMIKVKKKGLIHPFIYANHPFDLIGWDGYCYPWAFSIFNFEPITGRIHMPPPIHQNFQGRNFVICSFVPRLYDYHPQSIPAPYHHSNIDSDELLYYVDGDFMSRNNIEKGMFTLHPAGIPHGPHPGAIERSIGKKETGELAVMIDPFNPVSITEEAMRLESADYYKSWIV